MINVLTYCGGYPVYVYERFINTLFANGFDGMLYMFMKEKDLVKVKPFVDKYNNIECIVSPILENYYTLRFEEFKQFLDKREFPQDSYILLCDSRDVLFQRNINDIVLTNKDLYVSTEPRTTTMFNIENIVNDPLIKKHSNNKEICCGTIIATYEFTKKYLNDFCNYLAMYPKLRVKQTSGLQSDQYLLNYLVYCKYNRYNIEFINMNNQLILTLGNSEYKLNDNDEFVTNTEQVYYIVHQYDRTNKDTRRRLSLKHKCNFLDFGKKGCVGIKYQEFMKSYVSNQNN